MRGELWFKRLVSSRCGDDCCNSGAWINELYKVNSTSVGNGQTIAEAPYFAKLMGSNTAGAGLGFVKYSVSPTEIDVQTDFTSTFQESFSIISPQAPLSASFAYSPTNPTVGNSESFTVTASGGTGPYTFNWNFGDGSAGSGNPTTHTYAAQGNYTVSLTVTDSASPTPATKTATQTISVLPPSPSYPSWNP